MSFPSITNNFSLNNRWVEPLGRINIQGMAAELSLNAPITPNVLVSTINTGITPAGIAINGSTAYVANSNNYGITGSDSVSILNLDTNMPNGTITDANFNQPYTITINPAGTIAYVTNSASTTITMINLSNNTVTGVITGFDGPSGMVIINGNIGYVNNYGSSAGVGSGNGTTVRTVNLNTNTIIGSPITVGLAPAALAVTPNNEYVYVANYTTGMPGTGTVSVIQTSNNQVINTIPGFFGPFQIVITPDASKAYVSNFGSNNFSPYGNSVSVISLSTNTIIATITLGIQPSGLALTLDGSKLYVSNYNTLYAGTNFTNLTAGQGTINIIDTASNTVLSPTIPVGNSPGFIAIGQSNVYISNYSSNTVSVISL